MSCAGQKLPKFVFVDWRCGYAASLCLVPWKPESNYIELMKHLELVNTNNECSPYALRKPSWFGPYIDRDDLMSGVVSSRWINFYETFVVVRFISLGAAHRPAFVQFLIDTFIPYIKKLLQDDDAPVLQQCLVRAQGVVQTQLDIRTSLWGEVYFEYSNHSHLRLGMF